MQSRLVSWLAALCLLAAATAKPASASGADSDEFENTANELKQGKHLLLRTVDGQELEGRWRGSDVDSLYLESLDETGTVAVTRGDVVAIWVRGRATATGAKTLGISAATVGGIYGTLLSIYLSDISDDDGFSRGTAVGLVPLFALASGAAGAAVGALVGTAFPRWHLIYNHPLHPAGTLPAPKTDRTDYPETGGRITRFNLSGGYTQGLEAGAQGSLSIRAAILTDLNRHFIVGPEIGYAATGYPRVNWESDFVGVTNLSNTLHAGGVLYYLPVRAVVSPYLAAGLGLYIRNESYFGYSVGGGLEIAGSTLGPRFSLDFRYHDSLTPQEAGYADADGKWPAYATAGIGISF
jgi:hypothetical protein